MAAGTAIQFTQRSISGANERINSRHSLALLQRADAIANTLCHIDPNVTACDMGSRMVQTLVNAINWALKYNRKRKIKKIFKYEKYRHIFECYHDSISRELADLINILTLGRFNEQEVGYSGVPNVLMHLPGAKRSTEAANGRTFRPYVGKTTQPILQPNLDMGQSNSEHIVYLPEVDTENITIKQIALPTRGNVHVVDLS